MSAGSRSLPTCFPPWAPPLTLAYPPRPAPPSPDPYASSAGFSSLPPLLAALKAIASGESGHAHEGDEPVQLKALQTVLALLQAKVLTWARSLCRPPGYLFLSPHPPSPLIAS